MTDTIKWGILSTARINDKLIDPIRWAERSDLVAVASRDQAKADAYAQEKDIPKAYGSYEALLADDDIDAVYISLPNALHCEWTVKAAEAGKHVLCEKPITVTLPELDQVEAAAAANNVIIFEAFMYLHHPQMIKVQDVIASGQIGQVQSIYSSHHFYLPPENVENIRLSQSLTGGSLWDVGVYPVSAAVSLAGRPTAVWASQIVGDSGVDLSMRGQIHFADDIVAQISSSFRTPRQGAIDILGDLGAIHVPEPWKPGHQGGLSQIVITDKDDQVETVDLEPIDTYLCEVQAMEACILDGAAPTLSLSTSRDFLITVLSLYQSAQSGQVVKIV